MAIDDNNTNSKTDTKKAIKAFILRWFCWNRCFVNAFFVFSFFVLFRPALRALVWNQHTKHNSSKQQNHNKHLVKHLYE